MLGIFLVTTNAVGAVVVFCLIALVVPLPQVSDETRLRIENLVLTAIYAAAAILIGIVRGWALTRDIASWLRDGREAAAADQEAVLGAPSRLFWMQVQLWTMGALLFGLFNLRVDVGLGFLVAGIVVLAGLTVCAVTYLFAERSMRPLARRALESGVPTRLGLRTVGLRAMLAWLFGTGVAVLGIVFAAIQSLALGDQVSKLTLQLTMLVLGGTALLVGALTTWLAARASSDPVRSLRRAMAEVGRGRLDTHVDIYDGTELGILQAGFNDMVHGLRERETIRDLFGRHVGTDVARAALEGGVRLGGEVRDVAVLFVDIIGSTTLATERPPEEVVSLLNQFFDVVIDVVHEHDGWINKFEGDAALAIWGAPIEVPARNQRILAAARVMGQRLAAEVPEIAAGVGVSGGRVVAGNVGASERYEYTVIGDPVNEAARLTGHAKSVPARVVANARLLEGAGDEAAHWEPLEPVVVRGRSEPTAVMTPRAAP
jgi:adenylate cyclase